MAKCALLSAIRLLLAVPALAHADAARFDIAAQPLPAALQAFAAQARMQLVYEYTAVTGILGNTVSGEFDKRAALEQLLRGTGLEVVYSSDNAATIRPAGVRQHKEIAEEGKIKSDAKTRPIGAVRLPH